MKDKEAWATIGQFLVDFRQIAGICWEGLEIPSWPTDEQVLDKWEQRRKAEAMKDVFRKILDYIGNVTKERPKLLYAGEWDTTLDGETIEIYNVVEDPQRAYVIVMERERKG